MLKVLLWMGYIIVCLLGIIFIMSLVAIIMGLALRFVEWIQEEKECRDSKSKK